MKNSEIRKEMQDTPVGLIRSRRTRHRTWNVQNILHGLEYALLRADEDLKKVNDTYDAMKGICNFGGRGRLARDLKDIRRFYTKRVQFLSQMLTGLRGGIGRKAAYTMERKAIRAAEIAGLTIGYLPREQLKYVHPDATAD